MKMETNFMSPVAGGKPPAPSRIYQIRHEENHKTEEEILEEEEQRFRDLWW